MYEISLRSEMILILDQYLLQYVTTLFTQYKACVAYQSKVVKWVLIIMIIDSFVKVDPISPQFAHK